MRLQDKIVKDFTAPIISKNIIDNVLKNYLDKPRVIW